MKTFMIWIIFILIALAITLFIRDAEFTKTFPRIKLHEWWKPVGIILMVAGFVVYLTRETWKSYMKGYKEGLYEQLDINKNKE